MTYGGPPDSWLCTSPTARIAALPTPNETERQRDYWDDVLRGFGVRVSYGGRRAFVFRYRVNNRLRRLTLGPYPDLSLFEARRKAREVLGDVARGDDPAQDKQERRDAETFRGLAEAYLEMAQKRHRSRKEKARIINKDLLPEFGHRLLADIRRRDVRDHVEAIARKRNAPITRVYDRYVYDAEKRDTLERWARRLLAIIEGKTRKVVAIGR